MSSEGIPPQASTTHRPRRRPWRFSLLTLFVVLTAVCAWLGIVVNRAERQRQALASLKSVSDTFYFGYNYYFDETGEPRPDAKDLPPPGPEWLRSRIGIDYFADVHTVTFMGGALDDEAARHIAALPELRGVLLSRVPMGDAGLRHIATLDELRSLCLMGVEITDEGLAALAAVESLEEITLDFCDRITGTGFRHLTELPRLKSFSSERCNSIGNDALVHIGKFDSLEVLWLSDSDIDDAGLEPLGRLTHLLQLDLSYSHVSGPGLRHLSELRFLRDVSLNNSPIEDEGLAHLSRVSSLEVLWLRDTNVSVAGLVHLRKMTHLKELKLSSEYLSEDAIRALQDALPNTRIEF